MAKTKIMVDFHGTLMLKKGSDMINTIIPARQILAFLSGFPKFIEYMNRKMYANGELVKILNIVKDLYDIDIVVVSAAHEESRCYMEQTLSKIGLFYDELILRESFLQRHHTFKVEETLKLMPTIALEDCIFYAGEMMVAMKAAGNENFRVFTPQEFTLEIGIALLDRVEYPEAHRYNEPETYPTCATA